MNKNLQLNRRLLQSAKKGLLVELETCISNGADIEFQFGEVVWRISKKTSTFLDYQKRKNAIYVAAEAGHLDVVSCLARHGAVIDSRDKVFFPSNFFLILQIRILCCYYLLISLQLI